MLLINDRPEDILAKSGYEQKFKREIFASYLIYDQVWLNLPRDACHFFLHLLMDTHLACIKKFLEKHVASTHKVEEMCKI
jgi:hypothetical protein